jgi:hypothetical protein
MCSYYGGEDINLKSVDRGVVKFAVCRKGFIYGYLTLEGLTKWTQYKKGRPLLLK